MKTTVGAVMIDILPVSPELKNDAVRATEGYIRSLFKKSSMGLSLASMSKDIDNRKATMWVIAVDQKPTGMAFTSIEKWKEGRILIINAVAGENMEDWFPRFLDVMRDYRDHEKCVDCYSTARMGFSKYQHLGFKPVRYVYQLGD